MSRTHPALVLTITALALPIIFFSGCPLLPASLAPQPDAGGEHLVRLVHITDPQIVDEESPARAVRLTAFLEGAWRPQEAYGVHTLDATLQVINQIHADGAAEDRPVDFVLMTGDLLDSAQLNELHWFVDTMDGKVVTADSGTLDGPLRDVPAEINPKLPYDAVGLDRDIPWYTCYGNHDGLAVGVFPVDRDASNPADWSAPLALSAAFAVGLTAPGSPGASMVPVGTWSPAIYEDGPGWPFTPDGLLDVPALMFGPVRPDPARRYISKVEFIDYHLQSESEPPGHGFSEASRASGEAFYSVRPDPDVPLRLIVFDSVIDRDTQGNPAHFGALTVEHFENFIAPELARAEAAGEWVILASHHPATDFSLNPSPDTVGPWTLRGALSRSPNVIMHINGHTHRHRAEIVPGPYPYLEVSTTAIIDYPQEGRVIDVFLEDGGETVRIESFIFSHMDAPTTFSAESFRRSRVHARLGSGKVAFDGHQPPTISEGAASHGFSVRLRR